MTNVLTLHTNFKQQISQICLIGVCFDLGSLQMHDGDWFGFESWVQIRCKESFQDVTFV
jgi:hypothetical protein